MYGCMYIRAKTCRPGRRNVMPGSIFNPGGMGDGDTPTDYRWHCNLGQRDITSLFSSMNSIRGYFCQLGHAHMPMCCWQTFSRQLIQDPSTHLCVNVCYLTSSAPVASPSELSGDSVLYWSFYVNWSAADKNKLLTESFFKGTFFFSNSLFVYFFANLGPQTTSSYRSLYLFRRLVVESHLL